MAKKVFFLVTLTVVAATGLWGAQKYRSYRQHQQELRQRRIPPVEQVQATTIEGWTVAQIALALEKQNLIQTADFKNVLEKFDLSSYPLIQNTKPRTAGLEGFLFPDTYKFNKQTTSEAVITKMLDNFTARAAKLGISAEQKSYAIPGYERLDLNQNGSGLSFYQVLTLASIIEKESSGKPGDVSADQERALIAGVFYNRLLKGQALQSDATVNYATGKSTPAASAEDITINSPYNTYKYPGLPPGPICNPGLASINAALHPQETDYYYFFHKQPSGEVVFSKTFEKHVRKQKE